MKLLLILISILIANAEDFEEGCDEIKIDELYHNAEVLHDNLDRPFRLAVDYRTNILFFSYDHGQGMDLTSKSAKINLNTKEFYDIKGVHNGYSHAVDQTNREIYIGGYDGIYKYDYNTDKANFLGERGVFIHNLYFKDKLYYIERDMLSLFSYSEGQATRFKDLEDTEVYYFVIDKDDDRFFVNTTGLYSTKIGTKDAILYQEFPKEYEYVRKIRGLTTDVFGKLYVCFQDGIYLVSKKTKALEKILNINDAFGLAFDNNNNMIFSIAKKLLRLKPCTK